MHAWNDICMSVLHQCVCTMWVCTPPLDRHIAREYMYILVYDLLCYIHVIMPTRPHTWLCSVRVGLHVVARVYVQITCCSTGILRTLLIPRDNSFSFVCSHDIIYIYTHIKIYITNHDLTFSLCKIRGIIWLDSLYYRMHISWEPRHIGLYAGCAESRGT